MELIEHCSVDMAHKMLGVMTCPSVCNDAAIEKMNSAATDWTDLAREAKLSHCNFWMMADRQLKLKMFYGLGANTASFDTLGNCLLPQYYKLLPLGGIRRSVRKGLHQMDKALYGLGCPHPGVDCLIQQVSSLLMHYGSNTVVGKMLHILMELMMIKLGMGTEPFWLDYSKYGRMVTESWLKSLWEKADRLGITLTDYMVEMPMPRKKQLVNAVIYGKWVQCG